MRLLIMGPQGVGKGTQAALLSEHYGIPAISTGDIFRYNIKNKTELGVEALKYIDKGELVPDELTNKIVKDRLAMDDAKNGWILDGYPRNASQVKALDAMLEELGTPLDKVVALDADHDVLMQRMLGFIQQRFVLFHERPAMQWLLKAPAQPEGDPVSEQAADDPGHPRLPEVDFTAADKRAKPRHHHGAG